MISPSGPSCSCSPSCAASAKGTATAAGAGATSTAGGGMGRRREQGAAPPSARARPQQRRPPAARQPDGGPPVVHVQPVGAAQRDGHRLRRGGGDVLGVPGRVPGRGDGAAAAGVPAPVPRRVHRPVVGRALDVPDLQVGDRPEHGSWQPASSGLAALGLGASHGFACVLGSEVRGRN